MVLMSLLKRRSIPALLIVHTKTAVKETSFTVRWGLTVVFFMRRGEGNLILAFIQIWDAQISLR